MHWIITHAHVSWICDRYQWLSQGIISTDFSLFMAINIFLVLCVDLTSWGCCHRYTWGLCDLAVKVWWPLRWRPSILCVEQHCIYVQAKGRGDHLPCVEKPCNGHNVEVSTRVSSSGETIGLTHSSLWLVKPLYMWQISNTVTRRDLLTRRIQVQCGQEAVTI